MVQLLLQPDELCSEDFTRYNDHRTPRRSSLGCTSEQTLGRFVFGDTMIKYHPACGEMTERNADGRCVVCRKAYHKAYCARPEVKARKKANGIAYLEKPGMRARHNARQIAYFATPAAKAKKKAYLARPDIKAHRRAYDKAHYATGRGRAVVAARDHRRRARENGNGGKLSSAGIRALYITFPACLACGSDDDLTLDHVIPLALGGRNSVENIQVLCRSCNSIKHTMTTDYRTEVKDD